VRVALELCTLVGVDLLLSLLEVLLEGGERLSVALETVRRDAEVAQDLPRRRSPVGGLELAVRLLVAGAVWILQQVDASAEVQARLLADRHVCRQRGEREARDEQTEPKTESALHQHDFIQEKSAAGSLLQPGKASTESVLGERRQRYRQRLRDSTSQRIASSYRSRRGMGGLANRCSLG
jgi:hypothetical protein